VARTPSNTTGRAPARKPPPPKSGTRRKPSGRKAPARSRSAGATGRGTAARTRRIEPPRDDRIRDIWGGVLLVAAALSALGIWWTAAGTVGAYLNLLFRGLFGVFGLLAPVALAVLGVVLLREPRPATPRRVVGVLLCAVGAAGLWHLASGAPAFAAETAALHRSAGWLGAAVSLPLVGVAATPGAAVILLALTCAGVLVVTDTSPRDVVQWVVEHVIRLRQLVEDRRAARADAADDAGHDGDATVVVADEATVVVDPDADTGPVYTGLTEDLSEGGEQLDLALDEPGPSDTATIGQGLQAQLTAARDGRATKLSPPAGEVTLPPYHLPNLSLLRSGRAAVGNKKTLDAMTRALEHTLAQFKVDAKVARVSRGPTVTRFEIELGHGVKVSAVTKLGDDISYALATPEIRIVAPIPGKSAIGIEVPNRERDLITLGDVLRSEEATQLLHPLTAGIGVDIAGQAVLINLARMPHLLIAGATGSGKSVTMNGIITSVITRSAPEQARMILIDPKRVELTHYAQVPHLVTEVITDAKVAVQWLDGAVKEMEARYELLAECGHRNIDSYNAWVGEHGRQVDDLRYAALPGTWFGGACKVAVDEAVAAVRLEPLPYMLVVIDELADLMMVAPRDVESHIVRIAQMARAVGIHLVVATQRPSVDVVTGLIKANIPSRIALAMATQADSRTILDQAGAEKLVGDGDMLFMPANASKPHRIQGCYVGEAEIEAVVGHCRAQRPTEFVEGVATVPVEWTPGADPEDATDEDLVRAAMELVVRSGLGSTSMLQRKLKVGFARAGRLMDELETLGVVGPSEGPKARQVLMTVEEFEQRAGS
jgi:DNA segregation ATPase FtsK/SpoIIIE, S-DNA-T family